MRGPKATVSVRVYLGRRGCCYISCDGKVYAPRTLADVAKDLQTPNIMTADAVIYVPVSLTCVGVGSPCKNRRAG